jgi:O-antigen/teichoic acid export membrane protein
MLNNVVRLGEWLGFMVGLAAVGSFAAVALTGLTVRVVGTSICMTLAVFRQHGLSWGFRAADGSEVRSMLRPAVSFMAFPVANALSFQGITLLVGAMFGPVAVALFNTYRTLARVAVQVTAIFSHALWPEFSRLFGQNTKHALSDLFKRSYVLSATQALLLSVVLYLLSPWLLQIWTRGAIEHVPTLMALMMIYAAVGGIVHVPRVLLMATNQHAGIASWSIIVSVLSIGLAWMIGTVLELNGISAAMLASEFLMAVVCSWLAYNSIAPRKKTKILAS